MAAFSLIELVFVLGLAATLGAIAIPQSLASLDDARTAGAARYLSARLQRTRMEAVTRNASSAVRISRIATSFSFAVYVDGNRNGVLSKDITAGVDRPVAPGERLSDQFPNVDFGAMAGVPPADPTGTPPGTDPIRVGSSDMIVFTPVGTATPGSLYLMGRRGSQYCVRIFGETGRTRVLKFNTQNRSWTPI